VIGPWPSRPVRGGSTGACFTFFFAIETRVRPLRGAASREVFCSLQRFEVALRCLARRPASDSPTSTFDRPCGFRSAFRALRVGPCAARAAENHGSRRSDQVMRRGLSSARRSATWVRRTRSQPGRTPALGLSRVVRQRSWDFRTLRSVPRPRVPAFVMKRAPSFGASISAVLPHLPLSNSHRAVYFYSCQSRASKSVNSQTPSTHKRVRQKHATDCDAIQPAPGCCCRRRAEPGRVFNRAQPILPWALASPFGLVGCFFTARRRQSRLSRFVARDPPLAAAAFS